MFQKPADKEIGEGASGDDPHLTPLETIDITLKGGVAVKLYLNKLTARGKYRWQTSRYNDPSKASGSGATPEARLCSHDAQTPMGALRAWILAYGSRLEEESRRGVSSRVWTRSSPRNCPGGAPQTGGNANKPDGANEGGSERGNG